MKTASNPFGANVKLYPWYIFFRSCLFWGPAFILYFTSTLSLSETLHLEAVYYVGIAILEVPSGYLSDRFGRKRTLVLSSVSLVLAYLLFFLGGSFSVFAMAQILLASGFAAASGTDTALHFESLKATGNESEYGIRESRAMRYALVSGAVAAFAGGLLAMRDLSFIYAASAVTAALSLLLVFRMQEPEADPDHAALPMGPQVAGLLKKSWTPRLRFFTLFSLSMTILVHIPYEFYQPYLGKVADLMGTATTATPTVTGTHLAATMLIGAICTRFPADVSHRCKLRRILLLGASFQGLLISAMALSIHPIIAILLVLRTIPKAVVTPMVNAELSPLLEQHERSTYLSILSLLGRLGHGVVLLVLPLGAALLADPFMGTLATTALIALFLLALLWIHPFPKEPHHHCCKGHTPFLKTVFRRKRVRV